MRFLNDTPLGKQPLEPEGKAMFKQVEICWLLLMVLQSIESTARADDSLALSVDVIHTSRRALPSLKIRLQNKSDAGTVVDLGAMSADGRNYYPSAISVKTVNLRDAIRQWDDASSMQFNERRYMLPIKDDTSRRDYLVPIAPGGAYVFTTPLADWRLVDDGSPVRFKPGTNRIKVELTVKPEPAMHGSDDASQKQLWHGHLESRGATIVMPKDVPTLLDVSRSDDRVDDLTTLNGKVRDPSMGDGQLVIAGDFETAVRRIDDHQIEVKVGRSGAYTSVCLILRLDEGPDGELTGWATFVQQTDTPAFDHDFSRVVAATDGGVEVFRFSDRSGDQNCNSGKYRLTFGDTGVINGTFHSTIVLD